MRAWGVKLSVMSVGAAVDSRPACLTNPFVTRCYAKVLNYDKDRQYWKPERCFRNRLILFGSTGLFQFSGWLCTVWPTPLAGLSSRYYSFSSYMRVNLGWCNDDLHVSRQHVKWWLAESSSSRIGEVIFSSLKGFVMSRIGCLTMLLLSTFCWLASFGGVLSCFGVDRGHLWNLWICSLDCILWKLPWNFCKKHLPRASPNVRIPPFQWNSVAPTQRIQDEIDGPQVGNMAHELGHILGMSHEQQRPDGPENFYGSLTAMVLNSHNWIQKEMTG